MALVEVGGPECTTLMALKQAQGPYPTIEPSHQQFIITYCQASSNAIRALWHN